MKIIRPQLILFFCLISFFAQAQNHYQFDTLYPVHALDSYLMVFEDSTNELSLDQVLSDTTLPFFPLHSHQQALKNSSTCWATLQVSSKQDLKKWYLQFETWNNSIGGWGRGNGKVDVFAFKKENQIWHKKTGVEYPKIERDIKPLWNENRIFFDINAGDTLNLYIKVIGNKFGFRPFFNITLRKPGYQNYHPLYNKFTFLNKFLFGVLFTTLIYNILLFLYLRKRVHLWFSVWLFFTAFTIALNIDVGLINEFIIGNFPKLQFQLWAFFSNSDWFIFWFFGREFVGIKEKYPLLDKFIIALLLLIFIQTILYHTLLNLQPVENHLFYGQLNDTFRILFNFLGLILSFILVTKKDKLARYFGVGAILGNTAPIIGVLWYTGLIKLSFDPFIWGVFIQVIAYFFGLAYRQQLEDKAFKKSQKDLLNAERASMEMQRKIDLDELKSKFFANISHEFRTPLSLISGPLKLAKKTNESNIAISQKTFEMIERNTERLQELIDQLLDLSKIESGIVDLKLSQGGVIRFIKSIASDYENLALQKKISYNIHYPEELESAYYDKDKLQKIIHNLLSNAFKYTPEGKAVNLTISSTPDQLILNVTDTGPGIPADQLDKIFDRFYRIESSESKGSGIGLALTKELVQLLNGNISVNSQIGKGTTFKVNIPISIKALPESQKWVTQIQDTTPSDTVTNLAYDENKQDIPTVLIIEDNEDLRSYISEIINPHYKVILAEDGISGENLAIENLPNIIISDIMMPKRDGYELCKLIKTNIITSHIPVILLTAKAGQKNKMSGLTHGADAYMTKPFDAEELLIRINNFIEARNKIWKQFKSIGGPLIEDISLSSMDNQFFQNIQSEIQKNISNEQFSVEDLAKGAGFSRSQLHRKLKALLNKSPNQLIRETRLNKARLILENKSMSVSEAAYAVGFSNLSYFTKAFKDNFGFLPSDLK